MNTKVGQGDALLAGSGLDALRKNFLRNIGALHCLGKLEWEYPGGEREDLKTHVFPTKVPKLILAAPKWEHYVSVLLMVPERLIGETPEVEVNVPLLEVYLPLRKPTWRPNFVFCSAGGGRVELRCYGKFRLAARNSPASLFFKYLKQTKSSTKVKEDGRGRPYISLGLMPVGQSGDWPKFWNTLAALAGVVRKYKGRGKNRLNLRLPR